MSSPRAARPPQPSPPDKPPNATAPAAERSAVMLGPRDRLIGQLYVEGDLHVHGTLEGEVEATGDVEIEDLAKVKASVAGRQVSIRGQVNGPVTARKRLVVSRSGSLIGDVRVPRLVVQDGATFSGKVSMSGPVETESRPPTAAPQEPVVQQPALPEPVAKKAQDGRVTSRNGKAKQAPKKGKKNKRR